MITALIQLARLIADALDGRKTDAEVAKALITAAFESGVPAALLMDHLTELGRANAEHAADIAQWLKTQGKP